MIDVDVTHVLEADQPSLAGLIQFFKTLAIPDEGNHHERIGSLGAPEPPRTAEARSIIFNDTSGQYDADEDDADYEDGDCFLHSPLPPAVRFGVAEAVPAVAVDCGLSRLGETQDAVLGALRATMVVSNCNGHHVSLYRTGPLELRTADKPRVLHAIGLAMGRDDLFVELDRLDAANPRVVRVKPGAANHGQIYVDRLRNFLEKMVTMLAVEHCDGGVLIIDGSTTLRTRDTPPEFLPRLAAQVHARGAAIVAVSKKSTLMIQNKPLQFWLDDVPRLPCYRHLSPSLSEERRARNLGETYVARFSALGPCFRVDVCSPAGMTDNAVLNQFYASCVREAAYPSGLAMAHAMSYFTSPDLMILRAQAAAMFNLRPEQTLPFGEAVFGPFAGIWK